MPYCSLCRLKQHDMSLKGIKANVSNLRRKAKRLLEQVMIKTIKCVHQNEKLMFYFCATYYRLHWIEYDNNMKSLICTY